MPHTPRSQDAHLIWHVREIADIAHTLNVDTTQGLSSTEAAARLLQHGHNTLPAAVQRNISSMVLAQFSDFMIVVLIAAAIISGWVGEMQDTIAIIVILILNAAIGFAQEYRAEKAMAALRKMAALTARVRRANSVLSLPTEHLVPGDVVLLEAGNIVPADLRLSVAAKLRISEAALTGESHAVDKMTAPLTGTHSTPINHSNLGDRHNMAFKGTLVVYGRGEGIVVATGIATELGKIAMLLATQEEVKTPLQKRLARFGGRIAWAVLAVSAVVFIAGFLRGEPPLLMLLTALSLAVAGIPEALPAVVAISLALGAYRMSLQHALIRRLPAVETLGSVTYICTDKTGTLTQNKMHAEAFQVDGQSHPHPPLTKAWQIFFQALVLCNDATLIHDNPHPNKAPDKVPHKAPGKVPDKVPGKVLDKVPGKVLGKVEGEPTEAALLTAALQHCFTVDELQALQAAHPRIAELPFDSEKKRMLTVHRTEHDYLVLMKGAPEAVLPLTATQLTHTHDDSSVQGIDTKNIALAVERMANDGLRVLAIAYSRVSVLPDKLEALENNMIFIGLIGLVDPPRPEAHHAVQECHTAGITIVMVTGDHPATARAIARRLEILDVDTEKNSDKIITGVELAALTEAELQARIVDLRVFARVNPEQKIRIVQALQARGEFVAMTGDGVNDAPALRRADIGVAMGRGGTDVAREAAHLVLLDDNFATIVLAVREGRRIFDNIRKFVKYAMTGNSGEIWVIFLAPFLGLPIPLLPIHILWVNLVTDGLPGLALAAERAEKNIMQRPPRPPQENLFAHGLWQHIIWVGLLMGGVCLTLQAWAIHDGDAHWQSMVFTVLTLSQLGHVLAIRSEQHSLFSIGVGSNRYLAWAVGLTFLLQMATLYVPALHPIFKTEALTLTELVICLLASTVVFFGVEAEKWFIRRGIIYQRA